MSTQPAADVSLLAANDELIPHALGVHIVLWGLEIRGPSITAILGGTAFRYTFLTRWIA